MSVILALERHRKEYSEFEPSLATWSDPVSKQRL